MVASTKDDKLGYPEKRPKVVLLSLYHRYITYIHGLCSSYLLHMALETRLVCREYKYRVSYAEGQTTGLLRGVPHAQAFLPKPSNHPKQLITISKKDSINQT